MYSVEGWTGSEGLNPDASATVDDDCERKGIPIGLPCAFNTQELIYTPMNMLMLSYFRCFVWDSYESRNALFAFFTGLDGQHFTHPFFHAP
jgi:hypothetical protein